MQVNYPDQLTLAPAGSRTISLAQPLPLTLSYTLSGTVPDPLPDVTQYTLVWLVVGAGQFHSVSNSLADTEYTHEWVPEELGVFQLQGVLLFSGSGIPLTPYVSNILTVTVLNVRTEGEIDLHPHDGDVSMPAREGDVDMPAREGDVGLEQ